MEEFDGPATLLLDGAELAVTVHLRGFFQPIDGRYHWYGRVEASEELSARLAGGGGAGEAGAAGPAGGAGSAGGAGAARLRTGHGEAPAQLSDPDPWGRYRIDGVGRPPFAVRGTL